MTALTRSATRDERARMLFYGLDTEGLITGAWANMSYADLPKPVIEALHRLIIATDSERTASETAGRTIMHDYRGRRWMLLDEQNAAPQGETAGVRYPEHQQSEAGDTAGSSAGAASPLSAESVSEDLKANGVHPAVADMMADAVRPSLAGNGLDEWTLAQLEGSLQLAREGLAMPNGNADMALGRIEGRIQDILRRNKRLASPVAVPAGWKLVPAEPTREMIDAGFTAACREPFSKAAHCYRAMLAAAPECPPPAEQGKA